MSENTPTDPTGNPESLSIHDSLAIIYFNEIAFLALASARGENNEEEHNNKTFEIVDSLAMDLAIWQNQDYGGLPKEDGEYLAEENGVYFKSTFNVETQQWHSQGRQIFPDAWMKLPPPPTQKMLDVAKLINEQEGNK